MRLELLLDFSKRYATNNNTFDPDPVDVFCHFGRVLVDGGMRSELKKYSLKSRLYLGPTSLDTSLCFIMCNVGLVGKDSLVLDPFVGTASLLVTASHHGAMCFGTDIDMRVLRGKMHAGQSRDEKLGEEVRRKLYGSIFHTIPSFPSLHQYSIFSLFVFL